MYVDSVIDALHLFNFFFVSLVGWVARSLHCCSGRPPEGRRDPPRPGGGHRGQGIGGK